MENEEYLLRFFGLTVTQLQELISIALSRGGDFADLYFEHTQYYDLGLRDASVNRSGAHVDYGVGIRVIKGEQTGYAYTETTQMQAMQEAARTASYIASGGSAPSCSTKKRAEKANNFYPVEKPWSQTKVQTKIDYLQELNDLVFASDQRVKKVLAVLSHTHTNILYFNSEGLLATDIRPLASLSVSCVMQTGERTENAGISRSFRMGSEFITPQLLRELSEEVSRRCAFLFNASQPKGGIMPVVMGAGASGILLHEAIGHAFEADFNRKNQSIFSDKMGQKICNSLINVVDDGTLFQSRGSINIDDEGIPGQKTYMVRDGRLNSYLHDRMSAKYYGVAPTGNGRRESFRYMPIPRMRATYMENGPATEEQLIASVKKGIYVDNFSNGQVQIGAGDFTFFVKSGYLIEKGKLGRPIKDVNIIGNGPEALERIEGIANNHMMDNSTWTCGKEQMCVVSCGMPSVLVSRLTVGGHN